MIRLCIFDLATGRGKRVACNADDVPGDGEFDQEIDSAVFGWFDMWPDRYMWNGSALVEWPGWAEEEEAARLAGARASMVCGPLQIRKALRAAGLYQIVASYIETADEEVQEGWEYASEFKRLDPFVLGVQSAIGKTDAEVDAIFALALTL